MREDEVRTAQLMMKRGIFGNKGKRYNDEDSDEDEYKQLKEMNFEQR